MDLPFPIPAPLTAVAEPLGVFTVTLAAGLLLRWLLLRQLARLTDRTETQADNVVVGAARGPSVLWAIAIAIEAGLPSMPVGSEITGPLRTVIQVLLIVSITWVTAQIASGLLDALVARRQGDGAPGTPSGVSGLGQTIVRAVIFILGLMVLLNAVGVEIAPLLTALGVGGLAVALALQDTLGNFFAGVHLLLEKPFTIGDYVRLESGEEGTITDVGWRTTRLRTLSDRLVILPNSKLAGSTLVNYALPAMETRISLEVGVEYSADLDRVRDLLIDEVTSLAAATPMFATEPRPDAGVVRFNDSSIDFEVRAHVHDVRDQFRAVDLLHRHVHRRFRVEGINIPFPIRTVYMHNDA